MKTLRLIFILVLIGICNYCKAQSLIVSKKYQHITSNNFVDEMVKLVQRFDKEPMYYIRPLQSNCVFEILVNDILIYKEYTLEKLATPVNINYAILRSGIQTVTVRMYPIGDLIKETYGEGKRVNTLLKKTQMKISVVKYADSKNGMGLDDEEVVVKHSSPTKNSSQEFAGAGLDFFEYSFTFEANVPYVLDGWTDDQDLTEFDRKDIENTTLKYYNKVIGIFKEKNVDALANLFYGDIFILAQSKYMNKSEIQDIWKEVKGHIEKDITKYGELKNYKMNFYGRGKLVSLKHPSKEPVDSRLRGISSFWFIYRKEDKLKYLALNIDLHLPKGKSLDSLQTIR